MYGALSRASLPLLEATFLPLRVLSGERGYNERRGTEKGLKWFVFVKEYWEVCTKPGLGRIMRFPNKWLYCTS